MTLLLLDADVEGNSEHARQITDVLYGGDRDHRLRQEILLGVGGVRALAAAGLVPTVFHMNEGHSALLALERMRALIVDGGYDLAEARELVVASTVFTTHTPVPAGNEIFEPDLARSYLEPKAAELGLTWDDLAALAAYPDEGNTDFGMTPLALRTSGFANGVAALHGDTSRHMWRGLWPELPVDQVPITSITNGIHPPSWLSREMHELLDRYIGPALRERPEDPAVWDKADTIPAGELWRVHELRRERLVLFARERLRRQLNRQGSRRIASRAAADALRPDALTICFARRFATYKRADLLFRDPDRLARLLSDERRPVQMIVAGKAHPMDGPGKDVLRTVVQESQRPAPARSHRVPRGLRHARGPVPGAGRRRVAQRAAPPARGLGHQRHEGGRQRRAQPVGARRLVGRGLLRPTAAGRSAAASSTTIRRRTTPSRPRPSTRCSRARSSRPSSPATPRAARASGPT